MTEDELPGAAEWLGRAHHPRVYEVARVTPLDAAAQLPEQLGRPVRLKREDLQPTFSFKLRDACPSRRARSPTRCATAIVRMDATAICAAIRDIHQDVQCVP